MEFGVEKKRTRDDSELNGDGGVKRPKPEMESFTSGIGSKSKPCTKFFSISGCPFGEGCHFLHYVPGGLKAVTQLLGSNPALQVPHRNSVGAPPFQDLSSPPAVKTRLCNRFGTPEGCKFGDKCHFAHSEEELGKPSIPVHEDARGFLGRFAARDPNKGAAGFGASATATISIDASLAGAVIGKGGVNSKQICRLTGVRLSVRDHGTDPNSRNIELEGSFDQIKEASQMVQELIMSVSSTPSMGLGGLKNPSAGVGSSNFKTKLCENFAKGSCTFAERCHFAHGAEELRRLGGF